MPSGEFSLVVECPRCKGTGDAADGVCEACAGIGTVPRSKYHELIGDDLPDTDPAPKKE